MNWLQRHFRPEQIRELSLLLLIIVAVLVFGSLIDGYYTRAPSTASPRASPSSPSSRSARRWSC